MAKLFPFRPAEGPEVEQEPRLVNIDDEAADEVFAALSSDTARAILQSLYEEPTTASEVADAAETSLQNARYHLEKLQTAGLVQEVDTWYSSRGTEMTVYGPTSEPLVVAAGEEESRSILRNAIKRVVGAVGVLGIASVVIERLAGGGGFDFMGAGSGAPGDGGAPSDSNERLSGAPDQATATDGGVPTDTSTYNDAGQASPAETATPEVQATGRNADTATPAETGTVNTSGGSGQAPSPSPSDAEGTGTVVTRTVEATEQATATATEVSDATVDVLSASPGLAFFAGGLLVVGLAAGWWYWSRYRPLYGA